MYATDFEYAGEKLSDYGMMICRFQTSGVETISSGADLTFQQVKPSISNRFHLYSSTYDSVYSATFQICKNPCFATPDNMYLSASEVSSLQKWLCRKKQYFRFKVNQEGFENLYWNVTFSSKQIELNGNVIGLELTLFADAPFAYMDDILIEEDCSDILTFDVYDVSDEEGYIYPDMQITILERGKFTLQNSLSSHITEIDGCAAGEVITIDGKNQIITSSLSAHAIASDFNYLFPKIVNTYADNKNSFTCNLKCKIKLSYSPICKVGL